jgi:hypothetical protein
MKTKNIDKKGNGFLARLSGSTAEFMSMWALMMAGAAPFVVDEKNVLMLNLKPILPHWLFDDSNAVSFTFLGSILVTYVNPSRLDTWKFFDDNSVSKNVFNENNNNIVKKNARIEITDKNEKIIFNDDAALVKGFLALKIRNREVASITLYF